MFRNKSLYLNVSQRGTFSMMQKKVLAQKYTVKTKIGWFNSLKNGVNSCQKLMQGREK